MTLAVNDLDQQINSLRECGIDPGELLRSPRVKVLMIKDPDGNSIAFAEAIDPSMAQ